MKRFLIGLALVAVFAIPTTAFAVGLHAPHVGTGCADGGVFHFVANGVDGKVGALTVDFSEGGDINGQASTKYNKGTNHWTVDGWGYIVSASATEGSKLVLSDYTCYEKKDEK